ncbi:MAG: hypothetical protein KGJ86_15740, partial [Chloroflexota bacterium]|nr:hypothetical protein [Chloroflexota bacterium]
MKEMHHGFEWRIPFLSQDFLLSARVAEYGTEISNSPIRVNPRRVYEGVLESVERGVMRGWAWAWDPAASVEIEIFVDMRLCAIVPARTERPDLALAGIGNGRHGFAWIAPDELADGAPHEFACRIVGTSVWLSGSPHTAIIQAGTRSLGITVESIVRGCATRPLSHAAVPERRLARYDDTTATSTGAQPVFRRIAVAEPTQETLEAAKGKFWRPLSSTVHGDIHALSPAATAGRRIRLLIPIWGDEYIARFCRFSLPSLLAPNNLPYLARCHRVEVVFLTRSSERESFDKYSAYKQVLALIPVTFTNIDDILARYFDPAPQAYATALTYAFFRGIQSTGNAACDTDFLFWNADFLAADGVFRTLADLISAGVRCTMAPSLRVDLAIVPELAGRTAGGTVLDIGPREWVALASRFRHPTM